MDSTTNRTAVVGVFDDKTEADRAVQALHAAGFKDDQIGYIRRNSDAVEGTTPIGEEHHTGSGIGTGALIGGLVGAAAALLIPGVGPVLAGGVLASTFGATVAGGAVVGALGGAVAGGLIGALTDLGVPEDEARYADEQFQAGRTIVTVNAPGRAGEATEILRRYGAHDIQAERSGSYAPMAATSDTANVAPMTSSTRSERTAETRNRPATQRNVESDEVRVPVTEEKIVPRTQNQQSGAVEVRKNVVEETQTIEVPVRREEVNIERVRTDRPLAPGEKPFTDETIRVPVYGEQVTVEKQAHVVGEVVIEKEARQVEQAVSGTVRREEVNVERTGGAGSTSSRSWNEVMPTYRNRWQSQYGTTGGRWEDVEPAYRFAYESSSMPNYQGRSWEQAEPNLRRDWAARDPRTPWEKVKDAIRSAWDNTAA
jgi:uncharacterized protein (TIGR02271 family)